MDIKREANIRRETGETEVEVSLNLSKKGGYNVNTGIPFFNHLLEAFAKHGGFNISIYAQGDIEVDFHHLVEDVGIVLGRAFTEALGEKRGIKRFATSYMPMDESLVRVSMDISGRPYLYYGVELENRMILHFDGTLIEEFFRAFVVNSGITMHVDLIRGKNSHHILEAVFKAFGKSLSEACELSEEEDVPSTKGTLD